MREGEQTRMPHVEAPALLGRLAANEAIGSDHTVRAARLMEARETAILAALGVSDPYARPPRSLRSALK